MKIILTENQNKSLQKKLIGINDKLGIETAIRVVGSFNNFIKILGKEKLYDVLIKNGVEPDGIKLIEATRDIPDGFNYDSKTIRMYLNHYGPMYLVKIKGNLYLYQPGTLNPIWISGDNINYMGEDFFLGKHKLMGLDFSRVIDLFYEED